MGVREVMDNIKVLILASILKEAKQTFENLDLFRLDPELAIDQIQIMQAHCEFAADCVREYQLALNISPFADHDLMKLATLAELQTALTVERLECVIGY